MTDTPLSPQNFNTPLAGSMKWPATAPPEECLLPPKVGLHVRQLTPELAHLIAARPTVLKFSGGWEAATSVPPTTLMIGQVADTSTKADWQAAATPEQAAEAFVAAHRDFYRTYSMIPYWEGPPGPPQLDEQRLQWYARFEIARIQLLQALGLRCVIGNFAAGTPSLTLWSAFLPAIEAGIRHGALLGLQEYTWPETWWPTGKYQMLPGDEHSSEGWSTLHYRRIYQEHLLPRGLQILLVLSECSFMSAAAGPAGRQGTTEAEPTRPTWPPFPPDRQRLAWYASVLHEDPYVLGIILSKWPSSESQTASLTPSIFPEPAAGSPQAKRRPARRLSPPPRHSPAETEYLPPRLPYRRTYILLPQIADTFERLEWRMAAAIGSAVQLRTLGHSADDAGIGPEERDIIAVNPGAWNADLEAWYAEHYPGAVFHALEAATPWEMAIKLMPPLPKDEDIALAQIDPRWADYNFGEIPYDDETIGRAGCFITGLAIILRKHYRRAVTPPVLDKVLVAARGAYIRDNLLMWPDTVPLFSIFDRSIKDNVQRTPAQLAELLQNGWEIILRRADGGHFVYLERVDGDTLHIIDTWDGKRKAHAASAYRGIRAARLRHGAPPSATLPETNGSALLPPRESYRRTYVLLPQLQDTLEQLTWRTAAAIGSATQLHTLGHSADDAGIGPREREIIAINPQTWGADLQAWYDAHYPAAEYRAIETASPWEMAVQLMPPLEDDIALAQQDPRWKHYDFGAEPDPHGGTETIGRYGCFLTGFAIILRKIYRRDVTPPLLDKILVASGRGYVNDHFMAWETAIPIFPAFDGHIKDNLSRSAQELQRLQEEGWEIILRRADGGHFVYLERVDGDTLHIIDTWDGKRKAHAPNAYRGIRAAHVKSHVPLR